MITFFATILLFIVVFLLQDSGAPTKSRAKLAIAIGFLVASSLLYFIEYGTLRGIFILISVLSLVGTLFTLLRYKLLKV